MSAVRHAALLLALAATFLPQANRVAGGGGGGMFGDVNISAILDSFSISYDKRVRPNYGVLWFPGPPVEVGITMYVLSISSLSEVHMDFTLDFYFRQFWTDPRLAYKKRPGVETLSVGSEFIKNIWVPDTFFVNEKQSYFHIATTSNEFIRIHHSGSITRSIRLTITASCPMNLQYFPMDRQLCHIEIESFGYTMRDIVYVWKDGASSVGMSSEVQLPQFRVLGHRQRATVVTLSTGNAPPPPPAPAPAPHNLPRRHAKPNATGPGPIHSHSMWCAHSRLHDARHPLQVERGTQLGGRLQGSVAAAVQGARTPPARHGDLAHNRELLKAGVRNTVRTLDGVLPHPDLHTFGSDRDHIVGLVLAEPERDPGPRAARGHHRADDDNAHVIDQRRSAEDIIRQVYRRVPRDLLRHGFHELA
uniref:Gamma-aminobutyric acid receptor subunit beta n=1 Tax=Bombyx mori TaxID=7091 RepID=A0A8R2M500_BOMMO|nr:ionotropic GABA-aminobutyric acid receptor RDL3 isoform X10 [Bombyx mori]